MVRYRLGVASIFMALAMLTAACGSDDDTTSSGEDDPSSAEDKETVKIAFIGPLTGNNAQIGIGAKNAFELALATHNEDPDAQYRYVGEYLDDECSTEAGTAAALKAGSDPEVTAVVAHYCSVVALATVPIYNRMQLPATIFGAIHPDITYGNDFEEITRVAGSQVGENEFVAQFDAETLGVETVAAIHTTDDYGAGQFKYFSQFAEENGLEIVEEAAIQPDQTDFSAELSRIKSASPDLVWYGGLSSPGTEVRNQMAALGINAIFQGVSGINSPEFLEAAGANAEGVLTDFTALPPGESEFLAAYEAAGYSEDPQVYGPYAYAAALLQMRAIDEVGPDRAKVVEHLKKETKDVDTVIGPVTFDERGQNVSLAYTAYVAQDGAWVAWEESEYATGKRTLPS